MKDAKRTEKQLLDEADKLRRRIAYLEASEALLQQANKELNLTFELVPDLIAIASVDGYFKKLNPAWEKTLGFTIEELLSKPIIDFIHPDDIAQTMKEIERQLAGEPTILFENRYLCKNGEYRWLEWVATPAVDKTLLVACARDITEHKRADDALRESDEKFRGIVDSAFDGILIADAETRKLIFGNRSICRMLGYSSDEIVQLSVYDIHPEQALPSVMKQFEMQARGEIEVAADAPVKKKDGSIFYADIASSPVNFGGRAHLVGIFRDITERKKAEDSLRASERELRDSYAAQTAVNMILRTSLENIQLEEFLRKALEMVLSVPWLGFEPIGNIQLAEEDQQILVMKAQYNLPESVKKATARVPFGQCLCGKAALTQQIQFADHEACFDICHEGMLPYGHYAVPVVYNGKTLGVLNIFLREGHARQEKEEGFLHAVADTLAGIIIRRQAESEREKLHAQLLQAQKMEAVGQLAGGIAHDFNNILTAMIGYGHMLKMKLGDNDLLRSYAEHILSLSDKAANLTQSLLAFSRKQVMNSGPVNLNEIIRTVQKILFRIIGEDIRLQTELSEKDLVILADHVQLEQVMMNLAANARDAMPGGGKLTIRTDAVDIDQGFIKEHGFGRKGTYALVSVSDTGSGIDRETSEKVFEPFFTTKEVGKGTGLGLSMVYGIIKQHQGFINLSSEQGRGTTFRIYLPLIQAHIQRTKTEPSPSLERGTETILLAEDEPEVRLFTKKLLEEYGYSVIEAKDGKDATDKFKLYLNEIQLVLLDVIMPQKNGKEVYDEIKKIRPEIKVVFLSGYPADFIRSRGILGKGFAYIEKPVSPVKLLKKIRGVLNE